MRALVFHNNIARQAMAKIGGYLTPAAFVADFAPVRLEEVPDPVPPGDGWVLCDTRVAGICGSDAKQVFLHGSRDNPITALISFPHILGHEAVAVRDDTGARVVVDPWLSCVPRGIDPPCAACSKGEYTHCRNFTAGILPPSLHLGNCAGAGGVHADRFTAHVTCLHDVPPDMSDEAAVLSDPVSVSLRHVTRNPPDPALPALVYGCGTLALSAVALLRRLWPDQVIWVVSRPGVRAELAAKMGADAVLTGRPDAIVRHVAELVGVQPLRPWSRRPWILDGPGVVYDCVGSPESVETSLRLLNTQGTLAISGVEAPRRFEWTPLYFKEIRVTGSNAFGIEEVDGVRKHAFEHYFDMCAAGFDVTPLITHSFPLQRWSDAYVTIANRKHTGAVKVLLEP